MLYGATWQSLGAVTDGGNVARGGCHAISQSTTDARSQADILTVSQHNCYGVTARQRTPLQYLDIMDMTTLFSFGMQALNAIAQNPQILDGLDLLDAPSPEQAAAEILRGVAAGKIDREIGIKCVTLLTEQGRPFTARSITR